jgi:hypothetical protein
MKHTVRTSNNKTIEVNNYIRSMAIKLMCTECLGWETHPSECTSPLCPLFPFKGKTLKAIIREDKA